MGPLVVHAFMFLPKDNKRSDSRDGDTAAHDDAAAAATPIPDLLF